MSFMAFPFVFVSSAYVPVHSMPGWLQPVAQYQPVTMMVGAVRALTLGSHAQTLLGHSAGWFTVRALLWAAGITVLFATLASRRFARS
jgi:ABC-type multidrug transport system permease subunit